MQNRVIKFRAWNVATRVMVDLKKITPLALNIDTNGLFIPFSDGLPLMQYTGLKDKNGKEIYEGDIITGNTSYENGNDDYDWTNENPCVVQWHEKATGFFPLTLNSRWRCDLENIEVIGNIYEHAELFK